MNKADMPVAAPLIAAPTPENKPAEPVTKMDEQLAKPADAQAPTPAPAAQPQAATGSATPTLRIVFTSTETSVPLSMKDQVAKLADSLKADASKHVSLIGHAGGETDQANAARRVSFSRVLSVRSQLLDAGIDPMRINVQALGNKEAGADPDRVDIFVHTAGSEPNAGK